MTEKLHSEFLSRKIDGYKIIHKLTKEEDSKFRELHLNWSIFAFPNDPLGLDSGSYETFAKIAENEKPKLDVFVQSLYVKYNTDRKTHGIYKGYIVLR